MDVIERVKPVIIELERQRRSIVIVCHLAVLRYESYLKCNHRGYIGKAVL
jgi:broad specificity phosphatase PhoE